MRFSCGRIRHIVAWRVRALTGNPSHSANGCQCDDECQCSPDNECSLEKIASQMVMKSAVTCECTRTCSVAFNPCSQAEFGSVFLREAAPCSVAIAASQSASNESWPMMGALPKCYPAREPPSDPTVKLRKGHIAAIVCGITCPVVLCIVFHVYVSCRRRRCGCNSKVTADEHLASATKAVAPVSGTSSESEMVRAPVQPLEHFPPPQFLPMGSSLPAPTAAPTQMAQMAAPAAMLPGRPSSAARSDQAVLTQYNNVSPPAYHA